MKIYTEDGKEHPFRQFTFPDGQRHFEFLGDQSLLDLDVVTVETAIRSADELFDVLLAHSALVSAGYSKIRLNIRYLLAARMDRAIGTKHPLTLHIVADILRTAHFKKIQVLDPHSSVALTALGASATYPLYPVAQVLSNYSPSEIVLVAPDKGATDRVNKLISLLNIVDMFKIVQGVKKRDPHTGVLTGFGLAGSVKSIDIYGKTCLILDDICDGGGTFAGLAAVLREAGARAVDLFVTHGIFSKGGVISGIDRIYTTDSYKTKSDMPPQVTVLPVSMKE